MVRNAEETARSAEQSTSNDPGYCLQWSRGHAEIPALHPDAATAWHNAFNRHKGDRNPPRGAMAYWTGGSSGYGHIAPAVGGGKVRSSDAGGWGYPATVDVGWPERAWGLTYVGWADNVNDVAIPGVGGSGGDNGEDDDDMPHYDHASTQAKTKLPAGGWTGIKWDKVTGEGKFASGSAACKIGGRSYVAVLHVTAEAAGGSIRLRTVEVEDGEVAESNPLTEVPATSGGTYALMVQAGTVAKGRDLRFRISIDNGGTLTSADAVVLSW